MSPQKPQKTGPDADPEDSFPNPHIPHKIMERDDRLALAADARRNLLCCARCALRFAGFREPALYALPDNEIDALVCVEAAQPASVVGSTGGPNGVQSHALGSALSEAPEAEETVSEESDGVAPSDGAVGSSQPDTIAPSSCSLCVGCLEVCVHEAQLERLVDIVRSAGYQMKTFAISVSLPVSLLVRQRAGWLLLAQRHREALAAGTTTRPACLPADHVVEIKDAFRWAVAPYFTDRLGGVAFDPASPMTFHISASNPACETEHHAVLKRLMGHTSQSDYRKRQNMGHPDEVDSIRAVLKALAGNRADELILASQLFPPSRIPPCALSIVQERDAITITGKYRKLSRILPQSPWVIDGERKCSSSVQEYIDRHAIPLFQASGARFHSAGREDVDVRMLGEGRQFCLELLSPKAAYPPPEALAELAALINASELVEVSGVAICSPDLISHLLKEGEESHRKEYRAIVWISDPVRDESLAELNAIQDLVLQQRTPLRVSHRRSLMVRERTIHAATALKLSSHFIQLDLTTQAGTYIKEFVHGDFGRTRPSVGSILGCEADIIQLDVMDLHS